MQLQVTQQSWWKRKAVFMGSQQPSGSQWQSVMDKVEIATTGNAVDLGDVDQEDIIIVQYQVLNEE